MKKVEIYEVGPRDGLQNLSEYVPYEEKIKFIDELVEAGLKHIQITSFVSPKAIPQMKDSVEVAKYALEKYPDYDMFALVPNLRGAQTANEVGMKKIAVVASLSESHNKANINKTKDESFEIIKEIIQTFPDLEVCLDVATAFACPFEGEMKVEDLSDFVKRYYELGIRTFNICDTIGYTNPKKVKEVFRKLIKELPNAIYLAHIHDTRGMGIVNSLIAIEEGVSGIQSTVAGLGGCPFAPGASGNTSTEDLVFMLESMGINTGVNFEKIITVAKKLKNSVDGSFSGHHINIEKTSCIY